MRPHLTAEMQRALDYAKTQGGKLYRHPGGYWGPENFPLVHGGWFGATTMNGLVARGLASYTCWQRRRPGGRGGDFPVELTVKGVSVL